MRLPRWYRLLLPGILVFLILFVLVGRGTRLFESTEPMASAVDAAAMKAELGDPAGALEEINGVLEQYPGHGRAHYVRGTIKVYMEDYRGSIGDFEKAIELGVSLPALYNNCGYARLKTGDYDGAIRDFSEAIRLAFDHVNAYFNRAIAREKKGELDAAANDYRLAATFGADKADAFCSLARVMGKKGDRKAMYEMLAKVVELDPANAEILKTHEDFKAYRDDPEFRKLVGTAAGQPGK